MSAGASAPAPLRSGCYLLALACWIAASPPGLLPGAGLLVLPGSMAFYAGATTSRRPYRLAYAIGLVHFLWFSWSVRHVFFAGYVAIGVAGAVYPTLVTLWTRGLPAILPRPLAFALGVTATEWVRAHAPEICYPHNQPAHALYLFPGLLGGARWGGEVLVNFLVAGLGAALVDLARSWRVAQPSWNRAWGILLGFAILWAGTAVVTPPGSAPPREGAAPVRVVAVEPGFDPGFQRDARYTAGLLQERLLQPTREALERHAGVDLVLWPETSLPLAVEERGARVDWRDSRGLPERWWTPGPTRTLLVAGSLLVREDGSRTPAAVLVDAAGRVRGVHEKLALVPAGERIPFLSWLPAAWQAALLDAVRARMGLAPDFRPGTPRPPLATAAGVSFGALLCYDNAFDDVVAGHVARGARLLAVLSNESWYRGGAELEQMVAMSVFRCLETATPMVRSTVDGRSVAIDAAGRIVQSLPAAGNPGARVLLAELVPGPGRLPPLAWLTRALALCCLGSAIFLLPHLGRAWARLRSTRSDRGR